MVTPVSTKSYSTLKNQANQKRYIYDSNYAESLTFEAEIFVNGSTITEEVSREICRKLFNSNEYKWLKLDYPEWNGIHLNCYMVLNEKIYKQTSLGYGVVGYKTTISCDAPFAWEDADNIEFIQINRELKDVNIYNDTDYEKYTFPSVYIVQNPVYSEQGIHFEVVDGERFLKIPGVDRMRCDNDFDLTTIQVTNSIDESGFDLSDIAQIMIVPKRTLIIGDEDTEAYLEDYGLQYYVSMSNGEVVNITRRVSAGAFDLKIGFYASMYSESLRRFLDSQGTDLSGNSDFLDLASAYSYETFKNSTCVSSYSDVYIGFCLLDEHQSLKNISSNIIHLSFKYAE